MPLLLIAAIVGIIFGLMTIFSGGMVLFNQTAQQAAGNYIDFVLWFNFLSGFAYVVAGVGLWKKQRWAVWLAIFIAAAIFVIFVAFGLVVLMGSNFETRTAAALTFRFVVWLVIAVIGYKKLIGSTRKNKG